jgi:cytoskeleton protein RodZ
MPPIGETLREARMRQRLDIADVESRTKIRAKYLRALENEEWSLLPGPTFVRTFLRTYAEVVGIDPHLLVEEYRLNYEQRDEQPEFQTLSPLPREGRRGPRDSRRGARRAPSGGPRPGALALALVAVVLGFLLVLGLLVGDDDGGDPSSTTTTRQRPTAKRPAQKPKPAPRGVRVRIAPTEPTYVCVDTGAGTEVVFEGTLDAPRTFGDRRRVRLNLGKRTVSIKLNGRPVTVAESSSSLGLSLTRKGSVELPAGNQPCA